jgi:hypothetical protein
MSRENLVRELNEVLQRDYGMEHTIEDPISVCDLALIVLALSRGKEGQQNDRAPAGDEPGCKQPASFPRLRLKGSPALRACCLRQNSDEAGLTHT